MNDHAQRRRYATFLKRYSWLIRAAYPFYQLTRPRFSLGVVGIVFDAEGRVLLAEHVYHPRVPWGLPGGGVGRGEEPADALAREFIEELAMRVEVIQPLYVERTYLRHVDLAYLCRSDDTPEVSSSEILGAGWFSRADLPSITKFQSRALSRAYALVESETGFAT